MRNEQFKSFNCYIVLKVSASAGPQEIKIAWRAASMIAHPDRGGSNEAQQRVNIAYEVLSDPIQRRQHDIFWSVGKPSRAHSTQSQAKPNWNQDQAGAYSRATAGDALRGFQSRLDTTINSKKSEIWSQLDRRSEKRFEEFKQAYQAGKRSGFLWGAASVAATVIVFWKPVLWFVPVISISIFASKWSGIKLGNRKFSIFDHVSDDAIRALAREDAAQGCDREAKTFDKFSGYFASVLSLALRPSTFDDSEDQVARRLVVSFFFSGYVPESYDAQSRIIVLADGDERIIVRFRHRSGAAVNVTYLRGLTEQMRYRGEAKAILFCSPGLSGNAAEYAAQEGIRWYTLETMNAWINDVIKEDAFGPKGDILKHIESLNSFLSGIATRVEFGRRRYRRRRR
jgi:curved DNA-binding protein CbpA